MNKIEKDGNIAVLFAPGFGAGWSTWNDDQYREMLTMDADIVQAVLDGDRQKAADIATKKIKEITNDSEKYICVLGAGDLEVFWIPKGSLFEISEYDGAEGVRIIENQDFLRA